MWCSSSFISRSNRSRRNVILDAMAVGRGFLIEGAGGDLGGKIAFDDFLDVLADPQGIQYLHVWGKPSRNRNSVVNLSACSISSMDSLRQTLAISSRPNCSAPDNAASTGLWRELAAQTLLRFR